MKPTINLTYFDRRLGPMLFYSYPEGILDEELSHRIEAMMEAVFTERIFTINSEAWYSEKDAEVNWVEFMDKGISVCDIFILFCSPNSSQSEYVKDEWQAAYIRFKEIFLINMVISRNI